MRYSNGRSWCRMWRRNIKKIKIGNGSRVSIRKWTRITSNNDYNKRRVNRKSISTIGEKKSEKYFQCRNDSNIKQWLKKQLNLQYWNPEIYIKVLKYIAKSKIIHAFKLGWHFSLEKRIKQTHVKIRRNTWNNIDECTSITSCVYILKSTEFPLLYI